MAPPNSPPPTLRVAVASRDGKTVNDHFGRARQFLIFELEGTLLRLLEVRPNLAICQGGEEPDHTRDALGRSVDLLRDCDGILVAKIGPGPREQLEAAGVRVLELPGIIDEVFAEVVARDLLAQPSATTERDSLGS